MNDSFGWILFSDEYSLPTKEFPVVGVKYTDVSTKITTTRGSRQRAAADDPRWVVRVRSNG